jgi:hypothetical protein
MADPDPISPELALVDPDLRSQAVEELSRVEAIRIWAPYGPVRLNQPTVEPFRSRRRTPLAVAVCAYLGLGIVRVVVWGICLVIAIVVSIALAMILA